MDTYKGLYYYTGLMLGHLMCEILEGFQHCREPILLLYSWNSHILRTIKAFIIVNVIVGSYFTHTYIHTPCFHWHGPAPSCLLCKQFTLQEWRATGHVNRRESACNGHSYYTEHLLLHFMVSSKMLEIAGMLVSRHVFCLWWTIQVYQMCSEQLWVPTLANIWVVFMFDVLF